MYEFIGFFVCCGVEIVDLGENLFLVLVFVFDIVEMVDNDE